MSAMSATRWAEIVELMAAYWPRWEPDEALLALWREDLGQRNPAWVIEALKRVRRQYSSSAPEIKWVLSAFDAVRREQSARDDSSPIDYREQLRRERHEHRREHDLMRQALAQMDPDDLDAARRIVAEFGIADPEGGRGDDPARWRDEYVGLVHAATEMRERGELHDRGAIAEYVKSGGSMVGTMRQFDVRNWRVVIGACARHGAKFTSAEDAPFNAVIDQMRPSQIGRTPRERRRRTTSDIERALERVQRDAARGAA